MPELGTGVVKHGVHVRFRLGFTSASNPVMGLYERDSGAFICQIEFTEEEVKYFQQFFSQFNR